MISVDLLEFIVTFRNSENILRVQLIYEVKLYWTISYSSD